MYVQIPEIYKYWKDILVLVFAILAMFLQCFITGLFNKLILLTFVYKYLNSDSFYLLKKIVV